MPVTKFEIKTRKPFAEGQVFGDAGPYEQLEGVVEFAIDPSHAANQAIADLELAPTNAQGQVSFSSDFRILRPADPAKGNHRVLLDVPNRGKALALRNINSAPDVAPDAPPNPGNGFLMQEGYMIVWCGWQHDVPDVPGVLRVRVPDANTIDGPVSGEIVVTFQINAPAQVQYLSDRDHLPYASNDLESWDSVLTVQDWEDGEKRTIPREEWSFARLEDGRRVPNASHIYMESGFIPGKVYQVKYTTTGAPVVGLGHLATRDIVSFLRQESSDNGNPCAGDVEYAYAFGVSQSGRVLRQFLHLALNRDQEGCVVFDGFISHVAGGKRGEFNQRFAQPSSQASRSTNSLFPFSDTDQTDPETGLTDGLLTRLAAQGPLPKIMYVNTSSEYWGGHGALVHTDLTGTSDLDSPEAVRIYILGGMQHAVGGLPLADIDAEGVHTRQLFHCLDYRPLLRAALVNLDRWVTSGQAAPSSQHPRIADSTAVSPETVFKTLETIPGVKAPAHLRRFTRLDFGPNPDVPTNIPPKIGGLYPNLVSAVDGDGNETSGIRMPYITVPLATYTGWNLRHSGIGGGGEIMSTGGSSGGTLKGSTIPFPATAEERQAAGDPRLSVEERYGSKEGYLSKIEEAAQGMVDEGYLLSKDVATVMEYAGELYEAFAGRVREVQAADN
jgi:hypothetical protein